MWKLVKTLLGGKGERSPVGQLAIDIREAIKGKEIDPMKAIEMIHELNKAEAQHRSIFVAGWRPAIGWCGALTLFFNFIVFPITTWIGQISGIELHPPVLGWSELSPVVTAMLGIGTLRTIDKNKGKA